MSLKKEKPKTQRFEHSSEDKRDAFRYEFKNNAGFKIKFKEKRLDPINISAGGIAFANQDFKLLDFDYVSFTLNVPNQEKEVSFFAGLRILQIDPDNICHSIFEQCTLDQHELIHKYVLEMQKFDFEHQ